MNNKKTYKREYVRINLSLPLLAMGRCRFCGQPPSVYFFVGQSVLWKDPKRIKNMFDRYIQRFKRMCYGYYLSQAPREFVNTDFLTFTPHFKTYDPSLHTKRIVSTDDDYQEYLSCGEKCGATIWAFNEKLSSQRPEISRRRARYKYPKKFEEWD